MYKSKNKTNSNKSSVIFGTTTLESTTLNWRENTTTTVRATVPVTPQPNRSTTIKAPDNFPSVSRKPDKPNLAITIDYLENLFRKDFPQVVLLFIGAFVLLVMIWAMCSVCKTLMQREQRRERRRAKRRRRMSIENDNKPQTEDGAMTSGGWPMTAAQTAGERDMTRTENKRTIGLLPLPDGTVGTPGISLSKADLAFKASKDPKFILDDNKREKFEELMEELMRQEEAESQTDRAKRTSKVISKSDVQVISQSVIPSSAVSQPAIAQSTRIMSKDKILAMIKANASGTSKPTPISLKSTKLHAETDNGLEAGAAPKEMTEESETGQFETIEGNQGSSFDQTNFECDENDLLHPLLFEDQQPEMEADPKSTGNAKRVRSKTDRLCTTKPKVNRVKRSPSHKSFNRKRHR